MSKLIECPVIGTMHSPFKEKFGIPRQPNLVDVESYIDFVPPYNDLSAFNGLEAFSHVWLLWLFHQNKKQLAFKPQVRPPRLGGNKKIGVFATRSMYRPSNIGLSVVRLQRIVQYAGGVRVYVVGSDLLDQTPIIDIKPYIRYSDAVEDAKSGYAVDTPSKKQVFWLSEALQQRGLLVQQKKCSEQEIMHLEQVLAFDPTPAYQHDETRVYGMHFANLEVKFKVSVQQVFIVALYGVV